MNSIYLAVVDPIELFRIGVKKSLSEYCEVKIILEEKPNNCTELLRSKANLPNLVILLSVDKLEDLEIISAVKRISSEIKIIVISSTEKLFFVTSAIRKGADACILRDVEPFSLYKTIKEVVQKGKCINERIQKILISRIGMPLTEREEQFLHFICEEKSTKEIAAILELSPRTIETIRRNIKEKVEAKSVVGLVKYALRVGIIQVKSCT